MLMLLTTGLEVMLILYHYTDNDKNKGNPLHTIELAFPHSS